MVGETMIKNVTEQEDVLAHHGVKGMRWHHRKENSANQSASQNPFSKTESNVSGGGGGGGGELKDPEVEEEIENGKEVVQTILAQLDKWDKNRKVASGYSGRQFNVAAYSDFSNQDIESYLEHFGIRGMKWGQRRFQNEDGSLTTLGKERYGVHGERSALGTKHDLNKLDREQATAKARYDYYSGKAIRKLAKANRRLKQAQNSNNSAKVAKQQEKIRKINEGVGKKAEDYKRLLDNSKKMTDRIIKKSVAKGYSIKSRDCIRTVNRGRDALIAAGGIASSLVTGVGFARRSYSIGKHYRVRNDGLGTQTHRSRRFGETRSYW